MFKAFFVFTYLKTNAMAAIQLSTRMTILPIFRIFSVFYTTPDCFSCELAKTRPMIPKTRPTIGDNKPRTIDRIPKTSDAFFFSCIIKTP